VSDTIQRTDLAPIIFLLLARHLCTSQACKVQKMLCICSPSCRAIFQIFPCSITTAPSQPQLKSRLPFIDCLHLQRIQLLLGSRARQLELGKHVCQCARRLRRARRQQRHLVLFQRRLVPTRQGCLVTGATKLPACARHSLSASLLTPEDKRERPAHQCELARNCHSGCSAPIRKAQFSPDNDRNDTCHIENLLSPVP
jgi:hypothetical protein